MNNPTKKSNYVANITISIFIFLITFSFLFFTIKEGLIRSFANDIVNEMSAFDMVQKKHNGEYYNEESHSFEYIKGFSKSERDLENLRRRYNEIFYMFSIIPVFIILILIFVKGWSNIKSKVKQIDTSVFRSHINLNNDFRNIKWYISKLTFSYGFFTKRIVLGTEYFFSSNNHKQFIINHELRHLKFRDSIMKNFLINFKRFFLPIFYIFLWFSTFLLNIFQILFKWLEDPHQEVPDLNNYQIIAIIAYAITPILMIFLLRYSYNKITRWFSYVKELLADQYAMISLDGYIPSLGQIADDFHPSGETRMSFLNKSNRVVSVFPIFLVSITLLNINFGNSIISDENYFICLTLLLVLFIFLDIVYIRLHRISLKEWLSLLFIILIFSAWNFLILNFHQENKTFNFSPFTYIVNLAVNALALFTLLIFGMVQLVITKGQK